MPYRRRMFIPGLPVHLVQRGHNRKAVFLDDQDHRTYRQWMTDAATKFDVAAHAWCCMTNHVHLLLTPDTEPGISRMMQTLNSKYGRYFNRRHERTGTLWEARPNCSLIQTDSYLLATYRYIEMNPVAAGMVRKPHQYPWSTYRANALGQADQNLTPHSCYLALGHNSSQRQIRYRRYIEKEPPDGELESIREAYEYDMPFGDEDFQAYVAATLGRPLGHAKRGRPRKK